VGKRLGGTAHNVNRVTLGEEIDAWARNEIDGRGPQAKQCKPPLLRPSVPTAA